MVLSVDCYDSEFPLLSCGYFSVYTDCFFWNYFSFCTIDSSATKLIEQLITFNDLGQYVPLVRLNEMNPAFVNIINEVPEIGVPPLQNIIR